jgi:hypothetical protein
VLFRRRKGDTGQAPQREGRALIVVGFFLFGTVIVSALFPFRPALQAVDAALNGAQPGLGQTLAHLAVLAVAYLAIARVALARLP